jgi:hypothetical protein
VVYYRSSYRASLEFDGAQGGEKKHPAPSRQTGTAPKTPLLRSDGLESDRRGGNKHNVMANYCETEMEIAGACRHIVRGPGVYVPLSANEWLHEFVWTGRATDRARNEVNCGRKLPSALRFHKLRTTPGKTCSDVESVRTKDGATLTVKLMLFYRVTRVEAPLKATNDPFANIVRGRDGGRHRAMRPPCIRGCSIEA